jgi:hypothetical protein
MRLLSKPSKPTPDQEPAKEPDVTPTTITEAEQALRRAQRERDAVKALRPKTQENAARARRLLQENHLAERIRRSWV